MSKVPQEQPAADQYSDEETGRRLDRALRRSLTMPSKAAKKPKESPSKSLRGTQTKPPNYGKR
jgi:hypothetical protein